ncbi:MAG: 1-phosphofructokinase family hexose kinase [Spirochaetales bacterium]
MRPIITLTMNPAVDKSADAPRITVDTKLRCAHVRRDPGGGGINVSRAVAKLGGESTAVYVSGGVEGELLEALLAKEELVEAPVSVNDSIRENLTVIEEGSGDQYRFGMPGPTLSDAELGAVRDRLHSVLGADAFLVASGSLPESVAPSFYAQVADLALEAGAHFVLDTSGDALRAAVERGGATLIKPNRRELAELVGSSELEQPEVRNAAAKLIRDGKVEHVVVSLGAGGAYLVNKQGSVKFDSPSVPVKSRIGAGDSMIAGMVLALAQGKEPAEAVKRGVAAGAAAVMTPGTELCRREDAERIYHEISASRVSHTLGK